MSFNFTIPCQIDISYATKITTIKSESLTTPKLIAPLIQDISGNTGSLGQSLNATATGIKWNNPAVRVAGGGTYTTPSPAIANVAGTNFFVAQQNITSATTTAKYMITINYTIQQATGVIYATAGRQQGASSQVETTTRNLCATDTPFISANSIATPPYFATSNYATGAASTTMGSITLIDQPAYVGTLSYGLWIRSSACNITKYNITVLQVEP
jgi:hypothetical protein